MARKKPAQPQRKTSTVNLGIAGLRVPVHSHIAYLWENERDFAEAVGFVDAGLRGAGCCVVIGDHQDNQRVLALLEERGIDVSGPKVRQRLIFLKRSPSARKMLQRIAATFEAALAAGAPVVRLFGNVGWGREGGTPDAELLSYEARLAEIAARFPAVILCLHEVRSLTGLILRHGVLGTHPQVLGEGKILGSPYFVPLDRFLERLGAITANLAEQQRQSELLHAREQEFRAFVENSPDQIIRYDREFRRTYVNPAVTKAYGLPAAAFIGKPIGSVTREVGLQADADEMAKLHQRLAAVFATGEPGELETTWPLPQGQGWRTYHARYFPELDPDGRVINVLGIARDITERKASEEALQRSYAQLSALSARLRAVREKESARIAREVHDELGQMLTALAMDVEWLERKLAARPQELREALAAKLKSMRQDLASGMGTVQRIAAELRPAMLDELGLAAAVEWYVGEFQQRTGISCRLSADLEDVALDPDRSTALYRILQESLTNVARHADATAIEIRLAAEESRIVLAVADDGRGIPDDRIADPRSLGLLGMRERARTLGGDIFVRRDSIRGTRVEAILPL